MLHTTLVTMVSKILQLVSLGLNPLPVTVTTVVTMPTLVLSVIVGEGEVTVKVAEATSPELP